MTCAAARRHVADDFVLRPAPLGGQSALLSQLSPYSATDLPREPGGQLRKLVGMGGRCPEGRLLGQTADGAILGHGVHAQRFQVVDGKHHAQIGVVQAGQLPAQVIGRHRGVQIDRQFDQRRPIVGMPGDQRTGHRGQGLGRAATAIMMRSSNERKACVQAMSEKSAGFK